MKLGSPFNSINNSYINKPGIQKTSTEAHSYTQKDVSFSGNSAQEKPKFPGGDMFPGINIITRYVKRLVNSATAGNLPDRKIYFSGNTKVINIFENIFSNSK